MVDPQEFNDLFNKVNKFEVKSRSNARKIKSMAVDGFIALEQIDTLAERKDFAGISKLVKEYTKKIAQQCDQ